MIQCKGDGSPKETYETAGILPSSLSPPPHPPSLSLSLSLSLSVWLYVFSFSLSVSLDSLFLAVTLSASVFPVLLFGHIVSVLLNVHVSICKCSCARQMFMSPSLNVRAQSVHVSPGAVVSHHVSVIC